MADDLPVEWDERERAVRALVAARVATVGGSAGFIGGFNTFAERPYFDDERQFFKLFGFTPPNKRKEIRACFVDFDHFDDNLSDGGLDWNPKVTLVYRIRLVMGEWKDPFSGGQSDAFDAAIMRLRDAFRAARDFGYYGVIESDRLVQNTGTIGHDEYLGLFGHIATFTLRVHVQPAC